MAEIVISCQSWNLFRISCRYAGAVNRCDADGNVGRWDHRRRGTPLGLSRGFEPLHVSFPLSGGLVGVLRSIIEIPVLAMFRSRQELALGGTATLQLSGDDHTRGVGQPFESSLRKNFLAARLSRRRWTKISRMFPP